MIHRLALVRIDISEEPIASLIRGTRISKLGTTLTVSGNRRTLLRNTKSCHPDDGGGMFLRNVGSYNSHRAFFIVTAVKPSKLTKH
jgi:hypothetical protein